MFNSSFFFAGTKQKEHCWSKKSGSTSNSSRISTREIQLIIEKLKGQSHRSSRNYLGVWRQFNKFVIRLDVKPNRWEDRVTLFMGYKIDQGMQYSTVKSYVSAIKRVLVEDGYSWDDQRVLIRSLTSACKIINDRVHTRLPIQCSLSELHII